MLESDGQAGQFPLRTTYVLQRLTRAVHHELQARLAPHSLSVPEFTTLSVLVRRPGLSNAQLARRAYITAQSMQAVLAGLERRGLVERTPNPTNRRVLDARLTDAGQDVIAAADLEARAIEDQMLGAMDDGDRDEFLETLRRCVVRLGAGLDRPEHLAAEPRTGAADA